MRPNIVLVGMPGAGKSTIGVLLAKALSLSFIDTDLLIQRKIMMSLQEFINTRGILEFLEKEEEVICSLDISDHVVATGGSVVYRERSMGNLAASGSIVYLDVPLPVLRRRLKNIRTRGIVMETGESISSIYEKRRILYETYANNIVRCKNKDMEAIVEEIAKNINPGYL
ncbi:MAG: shikimate kinase [Spirochaetales bacterium]|nr:shikimate kinase [Spirochaetales bacterium]